MYNFSYILSIISDTFRLTPRVLHDVATVSLAMERRRFAPWDLGGGEAGSVGRNTLIRADGETRDLGSWGEVDVGVGEWVWIEAAGGGGWGSRSRTFGRGITEPGRLGSRA
jgi:N-methylhydantoinase B/oxoprolinase/acetone carboxylase alpha subunit